MNKFKAIVIDKQDEIVDYNLKEITFDDLGQGEVLIKVAYSSLNYKDALAVQANTKIINNYPMIPGIDLSGVVEKDSLNFKKGQKVLVTGFDMGMSHTGGFSEYACVPEKWVVALDDNLSLKNAMVIGTAGFTAALSINALEKMGMNPLDNPSILVTGATGGVGSIAIKLLLKSGYTNISALIRKESQVEVATNLGAHHIVNVAEFDLENIKPLAKGKYDYVLDTVGGAIASALIPQIKYGGSISMCGHIGGVKLATNVMPFIIRGINILGIDSVNYPAKLRKPIWDRFAQEWNIFDEALVNEVTLEELKAELVKLQTGNHLGRTIVKI